MILSSMSVMFMTQVTRSPRQREVAHEEVGEQERAEVADVRRAVDRRPQRVDADLVGAERHERSGLAGQRVVQADRHRRPRPSRGASARIDRPAPSAPSRLPVDALTLTASAVERRASSAMRVAHRIQTAAQARPAPTIVRSTLAGRQPAAGEPLDDVASASSPLSMPAASRVAGREQAAEVAQPGRAEQRVGDGVQRDVAVGVAVQPRRAVDLMPPSRSGVARPERMAVVADARPRCDRPARASERRARARSAGTVTLRLPDSPGTTLTGILQASSSAASSVNGPAAVGGYAPRPRAAGRGGALGRLGGGERRPVHRRDDHVRRRCA